MARFRSKASSKRPLGITGKVMLSLFMLAFFCGGAFFFYVICQELVTAGRPYFWKSVPCDIQVSDVVEEKDREEPYGFQVRYAYTWEGKSYASDEATTKRVWYGDYRKIQRLVNQFPPGATRSCYVNPHHPAQAVLFRQGLWVGFLLVLPLIFMVVGGGGVYLTWFGKIGGALDSTAASASGAASTQPLSEKAKGANRQGCLVLFFLLFLLAGSGFFYGFFLRPVLKIMTSGDWVETPCVVESSKVRSHRGDDSTSYSVDILYSYTFQNREYKSNRYHFMGGSSSGYKSKAAIVRRYPPGTETVCYVNPKDPTEAVLERGFTPDLWFGLIPLIFVIIGAGGILFTLRAIRRKPTGDSAQALLSGQGRVRGDRRATPTGETDGPVILRAKHSPWIKLLGIILGAVVWNGIISVFLWHVIKAWQGDRGPMMEKWFLPILLIPFVLVGLFLIAMVFYYFLALFNPRIRLTVSSGRITPGQTLGLAWQIEGRVHVLRRLHIYLEGREEATYTRGTRSYTDKHVFATLDLTNTSTRSDFRNGRSSIQIPADTAPTFEAPHNKILWALHVKGEIQRWPDLLDEFPIQILPLPAAVSPS